MNNFPLIVDGARTPFIRSQGQFKNLTALDLGRYTVNGLVQKTSLDEELIKYVCMGIVIGDPDTANIARELVLTSKLIKTTPAHTVSMACISSNVATTTVIELIRSGQIDAGIAGGVETFSDLPIRFSKNLRKLLLQSKRAKSFSEKLKLWSGFRLKDLKPDVPSPKEYSTGFSMGQAGDQLAASFNISRNDADEFALLSHKRADKAWRSGCYDDQVLSVDVPKDFKSVNEDDGPRPTSTLELLRKLPSVFDKFGINTAANSSFFSDGASALLLANRKVCNEYNISPLAVIKDYLYGAGDPLSELLLGPALTVPYLLARNKLKVSDIEVFEIHEAFAGQVLANLKAMASKQFLKDRLGLESSLLEIPIEAINLWGGSLSLGHPFGATGARLILTAAQRLVHEDGNFAVVTGCAASGLGSAILLQREES